MVRLHVRVAATALVAFAVVAVPALAQQVTKETVEGINNLRRLETTVACSGAVKPEAVAEIKKMGFVTLINLREASEAGANVEAEEAAAKAANLRYVHVPTNSAAPQQTSAEKFLAAITAPGAEPAFIHCAGGNRAAAMWLIKRMVVDKWPEDKATEEALALGSVSPSMKKFALDYAAAHK